MLDRILGKEIAHYVRPHRWLVALSMMLAVLSSVFVLAPAFLLQPFVDQAMKKGSEPVSWKIPWITFESDSLMSWQRTERVLVDNISPDHLLVLLAGLALIFVLLKSMTTYLSEYSAAAFSNRAVKSMREDLFDKFTSLHQGFFQSSKSGELIARATADLTLMQGRISHVIIGLIEHPLTAVAFLIFLLFMNYKLTLAVFIAGPMIVGLIRLFGIKVKKHAGRVQDAVAEVTSSYQETILCLREVQGFVKEDFERKRFKDKAETLYSKVMRWRRWELGVGPMMDATVFLVAPAVLIFAKIYFNHSLGEIVSMLYAFSRLYTPVRKLGRVNTNLKTLQGATKRVFGIMGTETEIKDFPGAVEFPGHRESIEFRDVEFRYPGGETVLDGISFTVKAGEMVAFVGSTGAGKSTLLDLLPRFYDVTGGAILIDGSDIRDFTLVSLRRGIGIVSQDVLLFNSTIADNIGYGSNNGDMERIEAAARVANAHDFIMAQPRGYETIVGDRGTLLSGGQRQRIAIARAILIKPPILILDEVASALDVESEGLVQEAIENLKGGHTILVVAHRLSTVRKAGRIYVLENGAILESGTFEDLMDTGGRFRQLYDMQFRD